MKSRTRTPVALLVVLVILMLTGCRYYYTKTGATNASFAADHVACIKEVGRFSATDTTRAYVDSNDYRGCMKLRGWQRAEQGNPGPEWHRGIERNGIYAVDALPEERHSPEASAQLREHCRQLHLLSTDWRHRLDQYERCLKRQ